MFLESIQFQNFKALRNTVLPLSPFTLIMGPNCSGKTTALQGLKMACETPGNTEITKIASIGAILPEGNDAVCVELTFNKQPEILQIKTCWSKDGRGQRNFKYCQINSTPSPDEQSPIQKKLSSLRIYSLDAQAIARPTPILPNIELAPNGANLAGVLDNLKDQEPERFEALLGELTRWLPEYDYVSFDVPEQGKKSFAFRTRQGRHKIPANELSQGTLLAFAILTLAYLPNPPAIIGLEEPDRGIHPRLLRDLRDAMYRLSYPESFGESREPVQVIVTSHSPYLLDLYRDHPEEIVLTQKKGLDVTFHRLSNFPHFEEIMGDAPLSEVWYSGILGGVPTPS